LVLCGPFLAVGTARATTDIFLPISGAAFTGGGVSRSFGLAMNNSNGTVTAVASLGHAEGGENGFTVFGRGNGKPFTCTLTPMGGIGDGFLQQTSSTTSAVGFFSMFIDTNLDPFNTFYSISCDIPGVAANTSQAWIIGVAPNH
jgi:hypothetical protein